jgi:hypothetical protein
MITRKRLPYAADHTYEGIHISGFERNLAIEILIFYVVPTVDYHIMYRQGEVVAYAQDISKKYGPPMKPHVHLRVERADPMFWFTEGLKWDFTEYA